MLAAYTCCPLPPHILVQAAGDQPGAEHMLEGVLPCRAEPRETCPPPKSPLCPLHCSARWSRPM
eukprot:5311392-Prymnesium_polylepis.1